MSEEPAVKAVNPAILLKACGPAEFPGVLPLLRQLWPELELDEGSLEALFCECLSRDDFFALCSEAGGEVVGFCDFTTRPSLWQGGGLAYVDELVVDERWRGRGRGTALLNRVSEMARELGCRHIALDSGFHREGAHRLYERLGFARESFMFGKDL